MRSRGTILKARKPANHSRRKRATSTIRIGFEDKVIIASICGGVTLRIITSKIFLCAFSFSIREAGLVTIGERVNDKVVIERLK